MDADSTHLINQKSHPTAEYIVDSEAGLALNRSIAALLSEPLLAEREYRILMIAW